MALKFLVDGDESQNILVQKSFEPTGSWNFFDAELTNNLPQFDATTEAGYIMDQTFRKKISEGSKRPFGLAVSQIADTQNNGERVEKDDVKTPYQLFFKAPQWLKSAINDELELTDSADKLRWFDPIKDLLIEGDVIYEVYAQTGPVFPEEKEAGVTVEDKLVKIADLKLKQPLVASQWGDEKIYFRHRAISKDRKYWKAEVRRLNEDAFFNNKDPENRFGKATPEWPENADEARD